MVAAVQQCCWGARLHYPTQKAQVAEEAGSRDLFRHLVEGRHIERLRDLLSRKRR